MSNSAIEHPKVIFLHGWGQSAQIWHQQIHHFSPITQTYAINLPGHGGAPDMPPKDWLPCIADEVNHLSRGEPVILVGWSLGGQVALHIQQSVTNLAGLVLVSSTPCFRQQHDWTLGCADDVWQGFNQAASHQTPKLMQRFFQMMLHGDQLGRRDIQTIAKEAIDKLNPPTFQGLRVGLDLLSNLDVRSDLSGITRPTLLVHGAQDVIVSQKAGQYLADNITHSELQVFQDCGHAPFLTHHAAFNQLLEQWCKNLSM